MISRFTIVIFSCILLIGCGHSEEWSFERKLPDSATEIQTYSWQSDTFPESIYYLKAKIPEHEYIGYVNSYNLALYTPSTKYYDDIQWLSTYGIHYDSVSSWWNATYTEAIHVSQDGTDWVQARYYDGYLYLYYVSHDERLKPVKPLTNFNANPYLHDEAETFIWRYKSFSADYYPDFNYSKSRLQIIHDQVDSSKIIAVLAVNNSNLANGPYVGFHKNKAIKLVAFYENDTILGWTNWYDTLGNLEERQVPFPPPLGNEGKIIYYEMFDVDEIINKCWSVRFSPKQDYFIVNSDNFNKNILVCCDSCILYSAELRTVHLEDTAKQEFNFLKSDTTFSFDKLKMGKNLIHIKIKGKQSDGSYQTGWDYFTVERKN
jgi:hypothetical protein